TTPASANPLGGGLKRRKLLGAPGTTAAATPGATSTTPGPPRSNVKKYSSRKNPAGREKKRDDGAEHDEDDEDDAEGEPGDDKKLYCFCKQVSWGNMVGCDNTDCQYEWFHWGEYRPCQRWRRSIDKCRMCGDHKGTGWGMVLRRMQGKAGKVEGKSAVE